MSTIKQLFADAGVENAKLIASIEQLVKTAESNKTDGIPESRFKEVIAQRNELRADKADLESKLDAKTKEVEALETTVEEQKKYKTELDEYKHQQFKEQKSRWMEKSKLFDVEETDKLHDRIAKIKDDFVFHEDDKEYTEQEIAQNLKMLKPYEKINYFGGDYKPPDVDDGKSGGRTDKIKDDPLSVFGDG